MLRVAARITLCLVLAAAPLSSVAVIACGTTAAATGITPVTGILIRSDALVSGFGCGTRAGQVFKYVAAVASDDTPGAFVYANAFDCFADGVFSNIPLPDTGNPSFTVRILAVNKDAYAAQTAALNAIVTAAQGVITNPINIGGLAPTWTTTCHATQQANIAVLAVCDALRINAPADAGGDAGGDAGPDAGPATRIELATASFPRADGGTFVCGTDFTTLRAFFDQPPMQTGAVTCPAPLVIDPAKANVTYHLDVTLTNGVSTVAVAMGCTATTVAGQTTTPTCPAFH